MRIYFLAVFLSGILGLASCGSLAAQADSSNVLESSDDVFTMKVYRQGYTVKLLLVIKTPGDIEGIHIERSDMRGNGFGQCKYLDFHSLQLTANDTILKTDSYPLPASEDALYRLRIVSADGISRVYPPVKLLAVKQTE